MTRLAAALTSAALIIAAWCMPAGSTARAAMKPTPGVALAFGKADIVVSADIAVSTGSGPEGSWLTAMREGLAGPAVADGKPRHLVRVAGSVPSKYLAQKARTLPQSVPLTLGGAPAASDLFGFDRDAVGRLLDGLDGRERS